MRTTYNPFWLALAALLSASSSAFGALPDRSYREPLETHIRTYSEQLSSLIGGAVSPEDQADVHMFVSHTLLNDALSAVIGTRWQLSPDVSLELSQVHFTGDHGAPLLAVTGRLHLNNGYEVDIKGVATLAALVTRQDHFVTRLQLVALEPLLMNQEYQLMLNGVFADLTRTLTQKYIDKLPEIRLPISQDFSVHVAGATTPLTFPAGEPGASISGNLLTPDFTLTDGLAIQNAVLLEDGLHLFLRLKSYPRGSVPADLAWTKLSKPERLSVLQRHNKVSYAACIHRDALNHLLQAISNLPPDKRTIRFQSTAANGHLWSYYHPNKAGPVTVSVNKANARLDHPDSLHATAELSKLSLKAAPGAITALELEIDVNAHAQIMGWTNFGLPIGGGAGTPIGTDAHAVVKAEGTLEVIGSGDKTVLSAALTKPDSATFGVDLHLEPLGKPHLNITVALPHHPAFSTPIPSGLKESVEVNVAGTQISRRVVLTSPTVDSTDRDITISGNINLLVPREP